MKEITMARIVLPVVRRFRLLFFFILIVTILMVLGLAKLRIENDIMFMLPDSNAEKRFFMDTQEKFGSTTGVAVAVSSKENIYDPVLLQKVQTAGDRILRINQSIPAQDIGKILKLEKSQALVLANLLFNLSRLEGIDFVTDSKFLKDHQKLEECLFEAVPQYLAESVSFSEIRQAAGIISAAAQTNPELGKILMDVVTRPTDYRKNILGQWVDQVSSVMETDTVWPEFYFFEDIDVFFKVQGFPDIDSARRFSSLVLETGLTDVKSLRDFIESEKSLRSMGNASFGFFHNLRRHNSDDTDFATKLLETIRSVPRQIHTGRLYIPGRHNLEDLDRRLKSWSLFQGSVYSKDEKSTLLLVRTAPNLNGENKALLLEEIRQILKDVFEGTGFTCYLAGEPVVDSQIGCLMIRDIKKLFPVVTLVIIGCLFIIFKNLSGVLCPIFTVMIALVWCFGAMGHAAVPVSIVATALPVLLVAVGTAYALHLTHAFQQSRAQNYKPPAGAENILNLTGGAVLMAGLTTVAGFGSLAVNRIIPLRDFGFFISLGVVFALALSVFLVPALMLGFPGKKPSGIVKEKVSLISRLISCLCLWCCRKPVITLLMYLILLVFSLIGFSMLKVEMNNITFFKENSPIRLADDFINQHFSGTTALSVVFSGRPSGKAVHPEVVGVIDGLCEHVCEKHPEIGKVISIADLIKKMNQAFYDNDPLRYRLPEKSDLYGEKSMQALHAQYEAYIDKYQPDDTKSLIDRSKKETLVSIQMKTASSSVVRCISKTVRAYLDGPGGNALRKHAISFHTTGPGILYLEANNLIVKGQIWSIILSFFSVFIVVAFKMRSFLYGLLSLIPLTITIMVIFGIMGFFRIPLDVATAITACVAIGIGIDYGIHYLVHYRNARLCGYSHTEAIFQTSLGTGRAIFSNAAAVTFGFMVLLASAFIPLINLGILISATMIIAAFSSMTMLPAVLSLAQPILFKKPEKNSTIIRLNLDETITDNMQRR